MSESPIAVDRETGLVSWAEGVGTKSFTLPGATDARHDPATGFILVLRDAEEVAILSRDGRMIAAAVPPEGFAISHFAKDQEGRVLVVCRGEREEGGWWDWHFSVPSQGGTMQQEGPAY